jgi:4-hydroxyphenylpyruvate dioxygenase
VDPDGLVQSQAIESGRLRMTLNSSGPPRTLASRFVERGAGSSVNHVAFSTDDIFEAAATLARSGFPVLEIGSNYYGDIEARFSLSPDFVAKLKAYNILYDEEGEGCFFQTYSKSSPEGLFFEILERQRGYGAPNAPFRIAAQKRAAKSGGDRWV